MNTIKCLKQLIFLFFIFPTLCILLAPAASADTLPPVIDLLNGEGDLHICGGSISDNLTRSNTLDPGFLVGDFNGDGVDDLVLGAVQNHNFSTPDIEPERLGAGEAYVFFGKASLGGTRDVAGSYGSVPDVVIRGASAWDRMGNGGVRKGDVNGDGIDDILLGTAWADGPGETREDAAGEAYVIYGSTSLPPVIDLSLGEQDVIIYGADAGDWMTDAAALQSADVNGDGIDDILLGAEYAQGPGGARYDTGEIYVIYGRAALPAVIDLALGAQDVIIYGANKDRLTYDGNLQIGDVNGDGIGDILTSALAADRPGESNSHYGKVYVVYGSPGLPAVIDFAAGEQDVAIWGSSAGDSLSNGGGGICIGEVNGDGIDDILVGTYRADGPGGARIDAGEAYVIFGSASLPAVIDLALGEEDVRIYGATQGDELTRRKGWMNTGDANGDGIDDILLATSLADGPGETRPSAGEVYIIYGRASLPPSIDLASGEEDVTIYGAFTYARLGDWNCLQTFDVNGDGTGDIIVGSSGADAVDVIYGSASLPAVIDLLSGPEDVHISFNSIMLSLDLIGTQPGDLNDDGIFDILMGFPDAYGPDFDRESAGEAYMVFGKGDALSAQVKDTDHSGTNPARNYGTARARIKYLSGDGSSLTTATLTRSDAGVNMADLSKVADVTWTLATDRSNFTADVAFHYLDSEIAGLNESDLRLFSAPALSGTFTEVPGAVFDTAKNRVTAPGLSSFSVFVLAESPAAPEPPPCFMGSLLGCLGWTRLFR